MENEKEFGNQPEGFNAMLENEQMDNARKVNNTWTFNDKGVSEEYALFVVNKQGNITIPITVNNEKKGYISANFEWDEKNPFFEHMDLNEREEQNVRDDNEISIKKMDNITSKNVKLFRELLVDGEITDLDEDGNPKDPVKVSREDMLSFLPETQSNLLNEWLSNFHIERYFPHSIGGIADLLRPQESIFFKCKIGSFHKPAHVLIFEFKIPNEDARRNIEQTFTQSKEQDGDNLIRHFNVNFNARMNYATRHFISVKGVSLETEGRGFNQDDTFKLKGLNEVKADQYFKTAFNPNWMTRLGNYLVNAFDYLGK